MANTLTLVREVVQELATSTFHVAVFGGWAEELLGVTAPRSHSDVDLLVFDPELPRLDQFVADRGEMTGKRFSHKRAFLVEAVVVELFIVFDRRTTFWDRFVYEWPRGDVTCVEGLPVAPVDWVAAYRRDHSAIRSTRPD